MNATATTTTAAASATSATSATDLDLDALPATHAGRYRHYKGGDYEVLGAVRHSETLEALVLYRALYGAQGLWVRPHAMFFGTVTIDGVTQPRFVRIEP